MSKSKRDGRAAPHLSSCHRGCLSQERSSPVNRLQGMHETSLRTAFGLS